MRRHKLPIAAMLLLTWAATTAGNGWGNPPFVEPDNINKTLVRWNETCTHEANCSFIYLKENVDFPIELLRLNVVVDVNGTEPTLMAIADNKIGLDMKPVIPHYFLVANYPGDYETTPFPFRARFYYDDSDKYSAIILLENVNDNEPVVHAPINCEVQEGMKGPTDCVFNVTDIDGSACYTKMTSTDNKFSFKLEGEPSKNCKNALFRLQVDEELDFETYRLHSMTIMVQDVGQVGPDEFLEPKVVFNVELFFVVNVGDIPDMDPKWTKMMPSMQVDELKEQTEQFIAIDGDMGLNWTITYRIETEDVEDADYFSIDKDSGLLSIGAINRDETQKDVYKLAIFATEVPQEPWLHEPARSISADLVLVVKDINNNKPEFEAHFPSVIEVDEGVYFSEKLFTVKDPDLADNGTFSVAFEKNDYNSNFMIVPTTGYQTSNITVASIDASKLDYEDPIWREITLKFVATENANSSHQGFAEVTIVLNDLNDEPPRFDKDQYLPSVPENQAINTLIETVNATDRDAGDIVEYFMGNNSVSSILRIDSSTGEIYTKSKAFDYERQTELFVQVYARDTADPPHQASCEVLITITNINDEKPILDLPFEAMEIQEHSEPGTRASNEISATDPDLELAKLTYFVNWTATQAYKNGVLVQSPLDYEGVLVLDDVQIEDNVWKTYLIINDMDRFDWEKFESLRVNVVVNDTATDPNYKHNQMQSGYVTVNVVDINDCAPVFSEESDIAVDVVENNTNYRLVGAVRATDDDSAQNADITYFIRPFLPKGLESNRLQLVVDNKTGQLYTSGVAFDCEQFEEMEYVYTITASDGDPNHDAEHNITVKVEDINDNAPKYKDGLEPSEDTLNPKIYEEQEGPMNITCLNAGDLDRTKPFNVITYFMENEELFEMKDNCLWAINGSLLDREDKDRGDRRLLTVYTRDNHENGNKYNSNEGDKVVISVTLLDINDNHPQLPNEEPRSWVETETEAGMLLFSVKVEDPDNGNNGTIECIGLSVSAQFPLDRTDFSHLFELKTNEKESTCNIYLNGTLLWGDYAIHLNVSDKGDPVRLDSSSTYTQKIINFNLRNPIIETPEDGKIFRIYRDVISENDEPLLDIDHKAIEDFVVTDEDDPRTPNGKVNLNLIGSGGMFTVKQISNDSQTSGPTKFRLLKVNSPTPGDIMLQMTLEASDRANPPNNRNSDPVKITVYFIDSSAIPEFKVREFETKFTENSTGLEQKREIPEAVNEVDQLLEEERRRPVYYYIIDGDKRFQLDKETRILSLKDELDYEVLTQHKLLVFATHNNTPPVDLPTETSSSVLSVIVEVEDENDTPPRFSQGTFYGVFRINDDYSSRRTVTTLNATDVDTNETIKYAYIKGSIKTTSPSLEPLLGENIFLVNEDSGEILLNFSPGGRDLSGYFEFTVVAYDKAGDIPGHRDEASVKVYVVSEVHQVIFNFFDDVTHVEAQKEKICPALTEILQYSCSLEKVSVANDESKDKGAQSDVYTHFINEEAPVDASVVAGMFLQGDTYAKLTRAMLELELALVSFSSPTSPEEDSVAMTIVLAGVCAVLGVLVIVFSLAFFVRTRTLNQRLEKLTMKKFGSQDSGLNRETLAVPGTNRHALEGSNPVWNHEIDPNFDTQSQMSGDSDLIGIEDSPEFGGSGQANPAFQRDVVNAYESPPAYESGISRRTSINPLAAQAEASEDPYGFSEALGGDMDVPRRFSINPLAGGGTDLNFEVSDEEPNSEEVDNVYFNSLHTSEPSTEL